MMRHFTNFVYLLLLVRAEAFFCDFETDLCGFTQDDSDTDNWDRVYYDALASSFQWWHSYNWVSSPQIDHTFGNSTGYYMLFAPYHLKVARLVSRTQSVQSNNNNTVCFQFWYHMNSDSADLNVYVQVNSNVLGNPVWSKSGGRGKVWHAADIEIQENTMYQVIIEGLGNSYEPGTIGIDDFMIKNSSCQSNGDDVMNVSCSFETRSRCGYRQDPSDDFDWLAHNGAAITDGIGPLIDHTLGTELGYYMYIYTTRYGSIEGHKARLISPLWTVTDLEQCVEFWYHKYGSGTLSLFIRLVGGALPASPAVKIVGHHGNTWLRAAYAMPNTGDFELVFEASRGSGNLGDIAIDDVLVYNAPCASDTVEPTSVPIEFQNADCNFDQGLCNYIPDLEGDFFWTRIQGSTPSWYTGPKFDHTYGNELGYYMYIEVSRPRRENEKARLMTPILKNKNTDTCVSFYYHMYGSDIDSLKVFKKDVGGGLPLDPISVLVGEKGNVWHYQRVDINGQTGNFQVVFEGTVGKSYRGDIAIDDIQFHSTSCDQVMLLPVTNISMNCDFEGKLNASMCGFMQSTSDDFDWQLHKGSTDSTGTGPSVDHTYGNTKGHYLYVEASSPRRLNEKARVVSPLVESANHLLCLKFWYHMKGEHVGKLILYRRLDGTGTSKQLWTIEGDQGDRWIEAWLPINYNDDKDEFIETLIQLIFEGVIGAGHLGDIAIDDIMLESHYCFQSETMDIPAVTLLSCDFEAEITQCGFSQDLSDVLDWKISNVSEGRPDIPNYSEISARQKSFAYITMAGRNKGDKANLATRPTKSNGTQRCLSFKYIKVGDVQQQLNVYSLDTKDALDLIGTVPYKETMNGWESCQLNLPVDEGVSKIMFEGVVGFGQVGYIALDDVNITTGNCTGKVLPNVPTPAKVVQAGDDGLDVVAKTFISFTVILLCLILVSVGVLATRHKYTKRVMQREQTENQASYHYAKDPDISSDVAVSNPVYDIARLGDTA